MFVEAALLGATEGGAAAAVLLLFRVSPAAVSARAPAPDDCLALRFFAWELRAGALVPNVAARLWRAEALSVSAGGAVAAANVSAAKFWVAVVVAVCSSTLGVAPAEAVGGGTGASVVAVAVPSAFSAGAGGAATAVRVGGIGGVVGRFL